MRLIIGLVSLALVLAGCHTTVEQDTAQEPQLMRWSDLTSRDLPTPDETITYGAHPAQLVDVWLPEGDGPHPVVLMVHGGCWQKSIADRTLMNYAAEDLRQRGMAVWNIEYRGVDEDGGGYPGTFLDVSLAAQALLDRGQDFNLKTDAIVGYGHSAGGHLVAWLAAQPNILPSSAVFSQRSVPFSAVVVSGGLADLETSQPVTLESCLAEIIDDLTGPSSADRPDVFADTSLSGLLPTDALLISVNGDSDRIAPPLLGRAFTELALAKGGQAKYVEISDSGHVELVSPGTDAFEAQAALLQKYLSE